MGYIPCRRAGFFGMYISCPFFGFTKNPCRINWYGRENGFTFFGRDAGSMWRYISKKSCIFITVCFLALTVIPMTCAAFGAFRSGIAAAALLIFVLEILLFRESGMGRSAEMHAAALNPPEALFRTGVLVRHIGTDGYGIFCGELLILPGQLRISGDSGVLLCLEAGDVSLTVSASQSGSGVCFCGRAAGGEQAVCFLIPSGLAVPAIHAGKQAGFACAVLQEPSALL